MCGGLSGKRVLITAAARGIGRATAEAFLQAGSRVHICDLDSDRLEEAGKTLDLAGSTCCDVASPAAVEDLFAAVMAGLGGLDVLVNNAGIAGPTAALEDLSLEDWQRTMAVNLDAAFLCARQAVPTMKAQRSGVIVNLSSTAGLSGFARRAPYCAAKWAIIGLTKTLAMELGPFGVRCNAICPGPIAGERMDEVMAEHAARAGVEPERIYQDYLAGISLRSFIAPSEIADMIVFLASDAAAKVSGQAIPVDGHTESFSSR